MRSTPPLRALWIAALLAPGLLVAPRAAARPAEPERPAARLVSGSLEAERDPAVALIEARRERPGPRSLIVFLRRVPTPLESTALAAGGIRLHDYLPGLAWRATVEPRADLRDPRLALIQSLAIPRAHDKIDPALRGAAGNRPLGLLVTLHEGAGAPLGETLIRRHGGDPVAWLPRLRSLAAVLPASAVERLAGEEEVAWIEPALPLLTGSNDGVRGQLDVESLWSDALRGLSGAGIDVLVFDQGRVDETHGDFSGRVVVGDAVGVASHSTHVAGTLAGDGTNSGGLFSGVARGARLISYALGGFNAGLFMYTNPGDLEANVAQAIQVHGADLANISLGSNLRLNAAPCEIYGNYGVTDRLLDSIVRGALGPRFPLVVAGGNERPSPACTFDYRTTAPPAGAKNILSVGAVNSDDGVVASFSAWGPTDDGRMKPDIVAPGCQVGGDHTVTSTVPGNAYGAICGTSMAAPAVTGVLAMILEDARARAVPDPSPAALRALVYHTALDAGPAGPDYQTGFGRLDPRGMLDLARSAAAVTGSLADAEVVTLPYLVSDPLAPFVATLAWDDPPAAAGAAVALVNDLDLRVYDPAGTRRYPWTLDPAAPAAPAASDREDHLNNMEKVAAPAGMTGLWRVEVAGSLVPAGPQEWSLVVTGGAPPPPGAATLAADRPVSRCDAAIVLELNDATLEGAPGTEVLATSQADPAGLIVTMSPAGAPGRFSGTLTLGPAGLSVGHDDLVVVSHAGGASAALRTDCVAPVITSLRVTQLDSRSARIEWLTDEPADTRLSGLPVTRGYSVTHSVPMAPLPPCASPGAVVASADAAGNLSLPAPVAFETLDEAVVFSDNMESGAVGWDNPAKGGGGNVVQWELTSLAYGSPVRAWTDSAGTPYRDNAENELISPAIDLRGRHNAVVAFQHRYAIEEGVDYAWLDYSLDRTDWVPVASWTGLTQGFVGARVPLPPETDNAPQMWLRFRLAPDNSLSFDGWYLDDVQVLARADCSEVTGLEAASDETTGLPRLTWPASPAAATYNVYRGLLPMTGVDGIATDYGACLASGVAGPSFDDVTSDPALSYFYLVTGAGAAGEGGAGLTSGGDRRPIVPCP